jgi:hypothetical protein
VQNGRFLIIVAVLVMVAVDIIILRQTDSQEIVAPVARTRRKISNGSLRMNTPNNKVLEHSTASLESVPDPETSISSQAASAQQTVSSPMTSEPSVLVQSNVFWSLFDWMEPIQDPLARLALRYVGIDPEAEEYWYEAINDPTLPENERRNLIEDLNEEGFPDPKNLTFDDLPLIWSRILIIEEVGPDAMDQINADAFAEAYMDLVDMYYSLADEN